MLYRDILTYEIRRITDPTFDSFDGFPEGSIEAAERWSEVFTKYAVGIVPPSSTILLAREKMRMRLLSVKFSSDVRIMEKAVEEFAAELAKGMSPIFKGVPPTAYLNYLPAYSIGFAGGSSKDVAEAIAKKTHEWFVTGTAINSSTSTLINWN